MYHTSTERSQVGANVDRPCLCGQPGYCPVHGTYETTADREALCLTPRSAGVQRRPAGGGFRIIRERHYE